MIRYLDTSLLVAALTSEPETDRVQEWLADQVQTRLAVSDWVVTEFSAALSVKLRTGRIDIDSRARALENFGEMRRVVFHLLAVSRACFREAADLADQHKSGLRGSDALHLAICRAHGATPCTLDRRLAKAGGLLGIPTQLV